MDKMQPELATGKELKRNVIGDVRVQNVNLHRRQPGN
jgi:hypothetical protein